MQINITIIPEGGQSVARQFGSIEVAADYLNKMIHAESRTPDEVEVYELSPVDKPTSFLNKLFGVK